MEFTQLTDKEFMNFVTKRPEKNFFQTVNMKNKLEKEGKTVYLVGVKDGKKVIGASLIASTGHRFMKKVTYEAYKGFILDYHNKELVKFMTDKVKEFLKSKDALRLIIDPYIPNVSRDMDANIVEGIDNRNIALYLKQLGYKEHDGAQVKWCYCLDINGKSSDELFKEMKSNTRNCINKTISKYKLNVRTLTKDELGEFKQVTSDTCDRRQFADKSLEYYQEMYDAFSNDVTFKLCELNCDILIEEIEKENEELNNKLNKLSEAPANIKKKENIKNDIATNEKKIENTKKLKEEKGNIIPLSVAMFMLYGDEVVYLFSGSYAELMSFYGQYRLQWEIIKYAAENGYRRYNFYGIQDVFNPNGKDRGVYEFKKGFGGYVEELLGSFVLPISSACTIYDTLRKVKSVFKK